MKIKNALLGSFVLAMIGLTNSTAGETHTVYTAKGIVKFVSNDISAEALSDILFQPPKPATRSIFDEIVNSEGSGISVAMLINFEFDSSELTDESEELLDVIGTMLNLDESLERELVIEGHTDIIGSAEYNLELSFRRAQSVLNYLTLEHDIDSNRLSVSGKGESELIDPTAPKDAINRRVQFKGV